MLNAGCRGLASRSMAFLRQSGALPRLPAKSLSSLYQGLAKQPAVARPAAAGGAGPCSVTVYGPPTGAMDMTVIKAQTSLTRAGEPFVSKVGCVQLKAAARLDLKQQDRGDTNMHAWLEAVQFQLEPEEGAMVCLAPEQTHKFTHDPYKGKPGREGRRLNTLTWEKVDEVYLLHFKRGDKDKGEEARVTVTLTPAQVWILAKLFEQSLPAMYGQAN